MGDWSRRIWPKPAGSKRSTAKSPPHRLLPVQEELAQSSTTSCCPRRWHIWCNRSKWSTLPLLHYRLSVSLSQALGVTGNWLEDGQSRPPRRCQWDRNARRNISNGPGLQRIFLSTGSWLARSRSCLVPDPRSLRDPTQSFSGEEQMVGHRARFSRPGHAQRHEETLQQKGSLARPSSLGGAGGWHPGRLEEGANIAGHVTTVSRLACSNLLTRSWPLGSRLGFSVTRSWHTLFAKLQPVETGPAWSPGSWFSSRVTQRLRQWIRRCWRQWAQEACQVGRSSERLLQGWPRRRRRRRAGRAAAPGQANGDVVAALAGFAQSQRQADGRPRECGRPLVKSFTRRSRRCVQDIQAHSCSWSRLHQAKAILQLPVELRVRFIDPLMAFEAKLVKPLSWSHVLV